MLMMNTASLFLTAAVSAVLGAQEPPAGPSPVLDPPAAAAEAGASIAPEAAQDAPSLLPDQDALRAEAEAVRVASIARADAWFAQLDTLQARFLQYSPGGVESGGDLALDRPGRVRFDYDDPSPILMVADGATVALADFALETIDRVPLSATPLRYVLGEDPLNASDAVDQVNRADERIYITLTDPSGETDGRLTLIFHDAKPDDGPETMVLEGWYAVDAMGGLTEVRLFEATLNERLDPRLFILDDDDVMGRERRRGRR